MDLERIIVRLLADSTQYTRTMDAAEARLLAMGHRMGILGRMFEIPLIAAAGAVTALGVAAVAASYHGLKLAASYESAAASLEVMTGSATKGQKLLDDITKMAVETPFKTPELLQAGRQLAAFGVEVDQIIPTLKVLGDVASGVGVERLPNIVLAFGQIRVAGRLMGQELRQLINANIPMIEYLAKVRQVPQQYIKGMVERAEISFGDVAKAFNMMVAEGGLYAGMNERRMKTVEGRWSAFVETVQIGLRELGGSFISVFGITDWLKDMTDSMGRVEKGFGAETFTKIRDVLVDIGKVFKHIAFWIDKAHSALTDMSDMSERAIKYNESLLATLGKILLILGAITLAIKVLAVAWALVTNPLVQVAATLAILAVATEKLGALKDFGQEFANNFRNAASDFNRLIDAMRNAFQAEDWQTLGELIGVGIKMGFKLAWGSLLTEMKLGLWDLAEWFVRTPIVLMMAAVNKVVTWLERQFRGEDVANKNEQMRNVEAVDFVDALKKDFDKIRKDLRDNDRKDLLNEMVPLRDQLKVLEARAQTSRINRQVDQWRKEHPLETSIAQMEEQLFQQKIKEWETFHKKMVDAFGPEKGWKGPQKLDLKEFGERLDVDFGAQQVALAGVMGGAHALGKIPGAKDATGMEVGLTVSAPAMKLAEHIRKEMTEGKWAGDTVDKMELFERRLGLLREASVGPVADRFGMPMFAGVGAMLNQKEYEFGLMEEFNSLKRALGTREVKLPEVAFRGSREAQDAINREQVEVRNVQEEIRNLMLQGKIIQEQTREYNRQVVEELKRLNGKVPNVGEDFGGGGDF